MMVAWGFVQGVTDPLNSMTIFKIDSREDSRIAAYRNLPAGKLTDRPFRFIVEGRLLVERLAASPCTLESVLVRDSLAEEMASVLGNVAIYSVPKSVLDGIVGYKFHLGVLACGIRPPLCEVESLASGDARLRTVVICNEIHDPENLGAILRNCAAFDVDAIILDQRCCDPFYRRVSRVSMGANLTLKLFISTSLNRDIQFLQTEIGVEVVAAVVDMTAERIPAAHRIERLGLVLGSEQSGVRSDIIDICDRRISIPMSTQTDSLNVAVASGICLYHFQLSASLVDPTPTGESC